MPEPSETQRPRWRRWLLEGLVVVGILLAVRAWQSHGAASGPAPAIDAIDLDGEPVRLGERERPALVHFMASWCGVCDAEEPNVAALARDHEVIAIATQSGSADEVRRWIATTGLAEVRVVPDPHGRIAQAWGVRAFPSGFYVDPSGEIRHVEVGYTSELGMRLRLWLASL